MNNNNNTTSARREEAVTAQVEEGRPVELAATYYLAERLLASPRFGPQLTELAHRLAGRAKETCAPANFPRRLAYPRDTFGIPEPYSTIVDHLVPAAEVLFGPSDGWGGFYVPAGVPAELEQLEWAAQGWVASRPVGTLFFDLKAPELLRLLEVAGAVDVLPARRRGQRRPVQYTRRPVTAAAVEHAMVVCGRGVREAVSAVAAPQAVAAAVQGIQRYADIHAGRPPMAPLIPVPPSVRSLLHDECSSLDSYGDPYLDDLDLDVELRVNLRLLAAVQRLAFAQGACHARLGKRSTLWTRLVDGEGMIAHAIGTFAVEGRSARAIARHGRGLDVRVGGGAAFDCRGPRECWGRCPARYKDAHKHQKAAVQRWAAAGGGYELARLTAASGLRSVAPRVVTGSGDGILPDGVGCQRSSSDGRAWVEPVAARQRDVAAVAWAAAAALSKVQPSNRPKTEPALLQWLACWLRMAKAGQVISIPLALVERTVRTETLTRAAHRAGYTWWK
eukprot:SAG22_NODE_2215_length_2825_cov_20.860465_3_plen_504_part_00